MCFWMILTTLFFYLIFHHSFLDIFCNLIFSLKKKLTFFHNLGTHALPHVGSGKKNEVAVLVLSFVSQMIMPKVFQCDLEAVKRLIAGLEADPNSVTSQELVQAIIDERCDGGRNIFHAAVSMCQPTSNKDSDQDAYSSQNSGSSFSSSFDIEPSLTSRAMNLRDMMRRAAVSQRYGNMYV